MSETPNKRACTTCVLCLREDYGYSNYTVEGTTLGCLVGLNPALDGQQEEPWRDVTPELAAALDVALTCPRYREGAPVWLDVDREGFPFPYKMPITPALVIEAGYTDDDEAAALLAAREWQRQVEEACIAYDGSDQGPTMLALVELLASRASSEEVARLKGYLLESAAQVEKYDAKADAAEQEVARLRAALEHIAHAPCISALLGEPEAECHCAGCTARRALSPTPETSQ